MVTKSDFSSSALNARRNRRKIWLVFTLALSAVLAAVFFITLLFGISFIYSISFALGAWFLIMGTTIVLGYFSTPQMNEDIVEVLGEYVGEPLVAGPHFRFPYFSLEVIVARVYLGEQRLPLYLDNKDGHRGDVEFQDCSASLKADFFFQILDSEKATYNVGDILRVLEEKAEHTVRAFFGVYTLDEAIKMKSVFKLENVVALLDFSKDAPDLIGEDEVDDNGNVVKKKLTAKDMRDIVVTDEELAKTRFFRDLNNWGVKAKSFTITDIDVPLDIKEQRSRVLEAEKNREVAKINIETAKLDAESVEAKASGESKRLELEGQGAGKGESSKIKLITDSTNLDPSQVTAYIAELSKWDAVKNNPNITLIEDSSGETNKGFKIGVGIGASQKGKNNKNK